MTRILPLFMLLGVAWICGDPILDYMLKDYQTSYVVVDRVIFPLRTYILEGEVHVKGKDVIYYVPLGSAKKLHSGKKYALSHGRRSLIIIGIRELVP